VGIHQSIYEIVRELGITVILVTRVGERHTMPFGANATCTSHFLELRPALVGHLNVHLGHPFVVPLPPTTECA